MKYKKIGKMAVAVALACTMVATPVFATPSVDELKNQKEKEKNIKIKSPAEKEGG